MDKEYIYQEYIVKQRSFQDIAVENKTYPNAVRRQAIKLGIPIRSREEAQSIALSSGRATHPTAGKKRTDEDKAKIGQTMFNNWQNISDEERQKRSDFAKQQWNNMSIEDKTALQHAAGNAIRKSSKEGSKLEKFLLKHLTNLRYVVEYHKEKLLANNKLQIDLFLPALMIAIEIDGPSHFLPIWGEANLLRNKRSDAIKVGLLLSIGCVIIRIKQLAKNLSTQIMKNIATEIIKHIEQVKVKFPDKDNRLIEISI
jgi:hypothetical protein